MLTDFLDPLIGGATALLVAFFARLPIFFRDGRASISKDLEIYNALPSESSQKGQLLERIDAQLQALDAVRDARRDWLGVVQAAFLFVASVAFFLAAIGAGGWWLLTVAISLSLLALAVLGLRHSFPKRVRGA